MAIDLTGRLDADQLLAATHRDGPLLILAGAGSGKTRTLTHRAAWLVDQGVPAESILLLTFTNKAADEMRDRAKALLDGRCGDIMACTYHSFCVRILRRWGDRVGVPHDFSILSSTDAVDAISYVRSVDRETYALRGFPTAKDVAGMVSLSTNTGEPLPGVIDGWRGGRFSKYRTEILALAKAYAGYKAERGMLDYDDLLTKAIGMVEADDRVRRRISDAYPYVMVDEYQDTNRLQERLLKDIRRECRNLVVVGDDYQSIYAFRGADIDNILRFPERFACDDIVRIRHNYRSTIEICDFANAVMRAHARFGYPKSMESDRWGDRQPVLVRNAGEEAEAEWVVGEMARLHDEEGVPWREIAVLARAGSATFRIENLLTQRGVAFEKYGGLKFLEYRCVLDVLAFLRLMSHQDDELAWFRVLVLLTGVGERYARHILSRRPGHAGDADPYAFLLDRAWARKGFADGLERLHADLAAFSSQDFHEMMPQLAKRYLEMRRDAIERATYRDEANRTEDLERLDEDDAALSALVAMTGAYDSAGDFLDAIILDALPRTPTQARAIAARADGRGGSPDMAVLSTIHSIKGLEYRAVFVLDCVDGRFPRTRAEELDGGGDPADMEELRCFYVAITRAKDLLYVCAPLMVRGYDRIPERGAVTHYLDGVDEDLYEQVFPDGDMGVGAPRGGFAWRDDIPF